MARRERASALAGGEELVDAILGQKKNFVQDHVAIHIAAIHMKRDAAREARLQDCEKVARELRAPNANFFKLARKYSDCMSRRCGGNLKPIGRLGILPRFEETAFNLKLWEVSDIIETRFGFHIIQRIP